jgi:isocitrate dehydrogenase
MKEPEKIDMVIFRENTEDVYAGIEWAANTPEAQRLINFLNHELGCSLDMSAAIGIKPMTERCSKRLIRMALKHAVQHQRTSVTLMHKGNIMKYTEGAFQIGAMKWRPSCRPRSRRPSYPRSIRKFPAGKVLATAWLTICFSKCC